MNPRSYVRSSAARLATLLVALLALLLGTAVPASAHAALIRTDPASGSVVAAAPQRVVLTFSEGVLLSADSLRVLDPRGTNVAVGTPGHADVADSGSTATVALRGGLGNGTYTVAWRAVSQDSHPVSGAFTFSIGAASKTSVDLSGVTPAGGGIAGTLYGIARFLAYAGFALLVGGSVFLAVCWPRGALRRPLQRLVSGGWAALVAATIALIMLRGPYVNGGGLGGAFDVGVMRSSLETRPGAALLSRLLLLAAAAVFLAVLFGSYAKREDPEERADLAWGLGIGGGVVAVGIAATWAMAEHASVGIQRRIAMPVDVIHLLSMAVWLGGLVTLLVALWAPSMARPAVPAFAVRRFSALALTAITLLVATGTYQAWRQIGTWRAFTDTSYGRLLLIKIGLVCALVAVAWFSRRWTQTLGRTSISRTAGKADAGRAPAGKADAGKAPAGKSAAKGGTAVRKETAVKAAAGAATGEGVTAAAVEPAARATDTVAEPVADEPADEPADGPAAGSGKDAATAGVGGAAGGSGDGTDSKRAAQLRRQQAARSAAQARKSREADPARGALRRSVLVEAGIAIVLLSVTTILSGSQPGRAAEEQKGLAAAPPASSSASSAASSSASSAAVPGEVALTIPYDTGGPKGSGTASFSLSPGQAGVPNDIHLELTGAGNLPVAVPEVRLAFTLPARHLGPIQVPLAKLGAGHYVATKVQLPLAGTWQLSLTVRTSDIDEVTVTRNVKVAQ
ncbi:copper resistance protein CopC [Actinacidiphila acidipaludis]|uniref:copper resistance protein CopC n=1 Tax=Actinacidiphila acidipaludis TaxID=2873382 RepID=UPI00223B730E|nr:copper resistance protein CopC [Streptomyces acidipaludis]